MTLYGPRGCTNKAPYTKCHKCGRIHYHVPLKGPTQMSNQRTIFNTVREGDVLLMDTVYQGDDFVRDTFSVRTQHLTKEDVKTLDSIKELRRLNTEILRWREERSRLSKYAAALQDAHDNVEQAQHLRDKLLAEIT